MKIHHDVFFSIASYTMPWLLIGIVIVVLILLVAGFIYWRSWSARARQQTPAVLLNGSTGVVAVPTSPMPMPSGSLPSDSPPAAGLPVVVSEKDLKEARADIVAVAAATTVKPVAVVSISTAAATVDEIRFTKDTTGKTNPGDNADWRTFQIGEIAAIDAAGKTLSAADYASAEYDADTRRTRPAPDWDKPTNAYDGDPKTITHTSGQQPVHRLSLKLKQPTVITSLRILNRVDCCQARLAGVLCEMLMSGKVVHSFTLTSEQIQDRKL